MKPRQFVAFIVALVICVTVLAWSTRVGMNDRVVYESAVIQALDQTPPIVIPATIRKDGALPLYSREDGVVTSIEVSPGDRVNAGKVLATLDVSESDLALLRSLEKLDASEGTAAFSELLASIDRLQASGYYNLAEAEEARNQLFRKAQDRAQFTGAMSELRRRTEGKILRAPFEGMIEQVSWQKGDLISASRQMNPGVTISPSNSGFVAQLDISEDAIRLLEIGSTVRVQMPGIEKDTIGKLVSLSTSPFISEKTRFYRGYAVLEGTPPVLDGLRASVELKPNSDPEIVWVPRAAFDLKLPDSMVSESVSYIRTGALSRANSEKPQSKEPFASGEEPRSRSAISRTVASDLSPLETDQSEIYLLTAGDRVVKARVRKEAVGDVYIQVRARALSGARVITNFRYERQGIRQLLGGR